MDDDNPDTRCGTAALVGRPNVGKSTILNALCGLKIAATTHKPQTTRRQLKGIVTRGDDQIVFVDTPGLHDIHGDLHAYMVEEALEAARGVDVLCLVVEAFLKDEAEEGGEKVRRALVDRRDREVIQKLEEAGALTRPVVLAINKIDRIPDKAQLLPLLEEWGEDDERFAALVPLSAEKGDGLDQLFAALAGQLPAGPFLFDPDMVTDAPEREIAAELIREKAMLELGEEIPYRLAVMVEEFDESRREATKKPLVKIGAVIFVERDGQKKVVVGKGGQRVKAIGTRARKELERLLDCQVFLQLFVRVEPGWTKSDKGLRKVGYKAR